LNAILSIIRHIVELYTNHFKTGFLFSIWPIIGHCTTYYNALQIEKSSIKKQKIGHISCRQFSSCSQCSEAYNILA